MTREAINKRLCESREPQLISDRLWSPNVSVRQALNAQDIASEAAAGHLPIETTAAGKKLFKAKLFQCDRINKNRRVYPLAVMQGNIDRMKKGRMFEAGQVTGAVDHLGHDAGGNLCDTCIKYHEIWIDDQGGGWGTFEIIAGTKAGDHLLALRKAGMAIGKSIYGYGTAHEPSDAEIENYGDGFGPFVVMDDNYTLKKIDAVDDPAVEDAWDVVSEKSRLQAVADSASFQAGQANHSGERSPAELLAPLLSQSDEERLHEVLGLSLDGLQVGDAEAVRRIAEHNNAMKYFIG